MSDVPWVVGIDLSLTSTGMASPGGAQANRCAHWFTTRGIPVFPLKPQQKTPANHNGFKGATLDPEQVNTWWPASTTNACNIGVPTGIGFDVIDIDRHGTVNGFDTLATKQWCTLLDECVYGAVATAGGGLHLYVATGYMQDRNGAGIAPGIDYRSKGGYVVAPPSTTATGAWRWIKPFCAVPAVLNDAQLRDLGAWIWTPPTA